MFIDRTELQEYPYVGRFYRTGVVNSTPLMEQQDNKTFILEVRCDITETSHYRHANFVEASFAIYFPIKCEEMEIIVKRGDIFEADQYGLGVNGKVIGVFPSQLHGCVVYVNDTDV